MIVTNVNGTFLMARSAVPAMLAAGCGRIVNITTSLATMQRRNNSPYGVTKAAIEAETLIWAQELKDTGVTVNSLIPGGAADTEFVHEASRKELAAMGRTLLPPSVMVPPVAVACIAIVRRRHRRALRRQVVGRRAAAKRCGDESARAVGAAAGQ